MLFASFLCGLVFAVGLGVSGMTNADTVLAFLDLAGGWDPTLAFVMVGAIGAHRLFYGAILRRDSPLLGGAFQVPNRLEIDPRLAGGAVLFGLGWGLSGYCPGPAVVATASGAVEPVVLTIGMLVGMGLFEGLPALRGRGREAAVADG